MTVEILNIGKGGSRSVILIKLTTITERVYFGNTKSRWPSGVYARGYLGSQTGFGVTACCKRSVSVSKNRI